VKGRKGKGGKVKNARTMLESRMGCSKLYSHVIVDVVQKEVPDLLFLEDYDLNHFDNVTEEDDEDLKPYIVAKIYLIPKVEIEQELDFSIDPVFEGTIDDMCDNRLKGFQNKYKNIVPFDGDQVESDDFQVVVDLNTSIDGELYEAGCAQNQTYFMYQLPEDLQMSVKEHKIGDTWETMYTMDNRDPEHEDEEVKVQIKLHAAHEIQYPEIDDDLVEKENFDSLKEFRDKFTEDFEAYLENAKKGLIIDHIMKQVIVGRRHPEIPSIWLESNVQSMIAHAKQQHGGDLDKLMSEVQVKDKRALQEAFKSDAIKDLLSTVVFVAYARNYDLDINDREAIIGHMSEKVVWREPEAPQEPKEE